MRTEYRRILVTAALPYANGKIHLGHLAGAYLPADSYARFQRSMGREVAFLCGSDEHGVPITITAEQEKITPQEVVDRYHALNRSAFDKFGMSFDNYSRTSLPLHHDTAREFFLALHEAGVLQKKTEKQLFDPKAKMFLPDRYVEGTCPVCKNPDARGDQCEKCGTFLNPTELIEPRSKITGEKPVLRDTVHWYFPLGRYQERLRQYIRERDTRDGWKPNVLQYCESWFKEGLTDRAVTRDLEWGVRVPVTGFSDKVLYVWFDAVLGYISSTKEWAGRIGRQDLWKDYWLRDDTKYIAFIGKDNVVFHCIVFPAMLMAWNDARPEQYILPENVPANEFLNFEGQKFSKSRGWGIDVDEFLDAFSADTLRYTLTMNLPESRDADFTWRDFQARTNNELADILGNLVNRTLTFAHRHCEGRVPAPPEEYSALDRQLLEALNNTPNAAADFFERYRFRDATLEIMNLARLSNKYFNDSEPWKTAKSNPARCAGTIYLCLEALRSLAILFEPILPFASQKLWDMLGRTGKPCDDGWTSAAEQRMKPGTPLGTPEILFAKIDAAVIEPYLNKLRPEPQNVNGTTTQPELITLDDFKRIDLRVAKIVQAEKVPKSEKLLKLQVKVGNDVRQIVAGIAQHYAPEDLQGKLIVVVANLQPAKLMGQESNGMLLAASDGEGKLVILTPEKEIAEGSSVK